MPDTAVCHQLLRFLEHLLLFSFPYKGGNLYGKKSLETMSSDHLDESGFHRHRKMSLRQGVLGL